MKAVIQRVSRGVVTVADAVVGEIRHGFVVLAGFHRSDGEDDVDYITKKILGLRVFSDEQGRMNRSVIDVGGEILLVSQFTLLADTRKGRRPGFDQAASPELAITLYEHMIDRISREVPVQTGEFGAKMSLSLTNEGPVTIIIDSDERR